ncbi:hypothetical protein D8674_022723 [Pyrus ussuriensis x Pyrus communis]|uniref:Isopenicillin N synthase-like Fe(2+) 2OG dioxygenase domain-containing protein n=1 Tax=Pyrus ussuriensis x Pyrus communis TaxID=2448454 RepID=A0A5N5GKQ4_9ROSA|nr:hypothetical protein D8674_022723 [Pyrus ussuriensis x Pyrus communis]
METAEVLQLYELRYSDLVLVSSNDESLSSAGELERAESTSKAIMEALGPAGPGLLAITGVPKSASLRRTLLPLARKLALLNPNHRKGILKDHNLGSDVPLKNPERNVSSFAMQIKYSHDFDEPELNSEHGSVNEFENLGNGFRELGFCMMELGLKLARVCDRAIGGNELEESLLESCSAKARLIHYHSSLDSSILVEEAMSTKRTSKRPFNSSRNWIGDKCKQVSGICSDNLWQQWHYDYGIFTVLTAPMFLLSNHPQAKEERDQEYAYPNGNTYLQIFDPRKDNVFMVKASPESFIVQVGESANIISRGKLHATLHSVCRHSKFENLSRETFVVFLQPPWNKTFSVTDYSMDKSLEISSEVKQVDDPEQSRLTEELQKIVPPLALRLKDGMTFADFSRETTKQYYGGSGLQSNR